MLLTSIRRLRSYYAGSGVAPLTASANVDRMLNWWNDAVSEMIEGYLNRWLLLSTYTEYFDVMMEKTEYFLKGIPVVSFPGDDPTHNIYGCVYIDRLGLWAGNEAPLMNYYIGKDSRSIVIAKTLPWAAKKALRVQYTGGLATHGTQSVYVMNTNVAFTAGMYIIGQTSGATAYVISYVSGTKTLTAETLFGKFIAGETVNAYTDEGGTTAILVTTTIASITSQSLAESYPSITRAAEIQIRYNYTHQKDFENMSSQRDGTTQRWRGSVGESSQLVPEAEHLLSQFRRMAL